MSNTSKKLLHAVALVTILTVSSLFAQAQSPDKAPGGNTIVTGCLQKGSETGEYSITGEDGKTYGLRSTSVKLADHLGHKVTVTGKVTPEEKSEKQKGSKAVADVDVSNLKMVSTSCP